MSELKVYTAGPLWSEDDLNSCKAVEQILTDLNIEFFAPRLGTAEEGKALGQANKILAAVMKAKSENAEIPYTAEEIEKAHETRKVNAKIILDKNLDAIKTSTLMLANIDNRDPGTMFEIGYAAASGIPVITYSAHNYGVNLMIGETAICHATSWEDLKHYIQKITPYIQLEYNVEKIRNLPGFVAIREKDSRPMD